MLFMKLLCKNSSKKKTVAEGNTIIIIDGNTGINADNLKSRDY